MIHLLWSLLNLLVVLFFLYLLIGFIIKGKKIFNPGFKAVSIFILVIGIIQITTASTTMDKTNTIYISENPDQHISQVKNITLEDNLIFDINLDLFYSETETGYIPVSSSSYLTGIVSGYEWEFISIQTGTYKPDEKNEFAAMGILKWNLFGINVYTQYKPFSGVIE